MPISRSREIPSAKSANRRGQLIRDSVPAVAIFVVLVQRTWWKQNLLFAVYCEDRTTKLLENIKLDAGKTMMDFDEEAVAVHQ